MLQEGAESPNDRPPAPAVSVVLAPFEDTLPRWLANGDAALREASARAAVEALAAAAGGGGAPLKVGDHFSGPAVRPGGEEGDEDGDGEEEEGGEAAVVEWKVVGLSVSKPAGEGAAGGEEEVDEAVADDVEDDEGVDAVVACLVGSSELVFDGEALDRDDDDDALNEVPVFGSAPQPTNQPTNYPQQGCASTAHMRHAACHEQLPHAPRFARPPRAPPPLARR